MSYNILSYIQSNFYLESLENNKHTTILIFKFLFSIICVCSMYVSKGCVHTCPWSKVHVKVEDFLESEFSF